MEHLKDIQRQLVSCVEAQMGNIKDVNTHELGEAIDMIKDIYMAEYYHSVVKAMEEAEEEKDEKRLVTNNYYTEYPMRRMYDYPRRTRTPAEVYYDFPSHGYDEPHGHDPRDGKSYTSRRMYMEGKELHHDKEMQLKELEKYMAELSQDMTEMIADSSPEEKHMLHQRLTSLANKIELLSK